MTSRTDDYHCPRCRRYLFSAYTVWMSPEQRDALRERARVACKCGKKPLPEEVGINGLTEAETSATASVAGLVGTKE